MIIIDIYKASAPPRAKSSGKSPTGGAAMECKPTTKKAQLSILIYTPETMEQNLAYSIFNKFKEVFDYYRHVQSPPPPGKSSAKSPTSGAAMECKPTTKEAQLSILIYTPETMEQNLAYSIFNKFDEVFDYYRLYKASTPPPRTKSSAKSTTSGAAMECKPTTKEAQLSILIHTPETMEQNLAYSIFNKFDQVFDNYRRVQSFSPSPPGKIFRYNPSPDRWGSHGVQTHYKRGPTQHFDIYSRNNGTKFGIQYFQ